MSKTENDFEDSLEYWRDLAKMLREELKKEQASRELKLPSEKIEYWIDNTNRLPNYNLNAMFHYVHEMVKFLNEIKALNEGQGKV